MLNDDLAISVRNISKKYRLFDSVQERLKEALHPFQKKYHREFWALKNVSFDVSKGSTLGIVGRNGSGKSTLLQIISSVLLPTVGNLELSGRVSALLELGAGLNPEFTGRENVIFYGAVMGYSEKEMNARLPFIREFADIGEFFDQPVRVYSSGMFSRLAFATAINIDPDILIVDEALSVGDPKFQKKCYRKIHEFQKSGVTILLVTHDVESIIRHCDQALLLVEGELVEMGEPKTVVNFYIDVLEGRKVSTAVSNYDFDEKSLAEVRKTDQNVPKTILDQFLSGFSGQDNCVSRKSYNKNEYRQGNGNAEIVDYLLICKDKVDFSAVQSGCQLEIYWKVLFHEDVEFPSYGFAVCSVDGLKLWGGNTWFDKFPVQPARTGDYVIFKSSFSLHLNKGEYFITLGCGQVLNEQLCPMDRRCDLIHIVVETRSRFDGLVALNVAFSEIVKKQGHEN
ncbi:MAG: sugar ABC transporter ATP-binding protein [Nitrospinae bacterium CG11_big_fil_rev_8_21_14_0_20_45_15]|nr:MAG: sugar ABC transporter ATP-binding protein [Nitrospinae bacterium CG11_big_fil_rev_8_21_14_0_20_45_15]